MLTRVIQDISRYLTEYLDRAIIVALAFSLGRFMCSFFLMLKEERYFHWRKWMRMLFALLIDFVVVFYVFMVIVITFFSRMEGSVDVVNLRLFSTFGSDLQSKVFIIENIVMFIPLGMFLRGYGVRRFTIAAILILGASTTIEVLQGLTGRGRTEIDDVLTNVTGGAIGFIVMSLMLKIKYIMEKRRKR